MINKILWSFFGWIIIYILLNIGSLKVTEYYPPLSDFMAYFYMLNLAFAAFLIAGLHRMFSDTKEPVTIAKPSHLEAEKRNNQKRRIYNMPAKGLESYVVFDVETTGLNPVKDQIVQMGALKVKNNLVVDEFECFVKITGKMPQAASKINGITDSILRKEGIPLKVAVEKLYDFVEGEPVLAYNARFDADFLDAASKTYNVQFTQRFICLLRYARNKWPNLSSYKLIEVCKVLGVAEQQEHRALSDCYLAYQMLQVED